MGGSDLSNQQPHSRRPVLGGVRQRCETVCSAHKAGEGCNRKAHLKMWASVSQQARYGRNVGNSVMLFISTSDRKIHNVPGKTILWNSLLTDEAEVELTKANMGQYHIQGENTACSTNTQAGKC